MRKTILLGVALSLLVLPAGRTLAQAKTAAIDHGDWAPMKALLGAWIAKSSEMGEVHTTFVSYAAGSAILETLEMPGEDNMVTMFNLDDAGHVMLSHYCNMGHQTRMKAGVLTGRTLVFEFLDGTNLPAAGGYMRRLKLVFADDNHFVESWTIRKGAAESQLTLEFERVK